MTPWYDDGQARFYLGDVREVLRELPAGSVNMCVTSPPYWSLRDYGIEPNVWGGDENCAHEWGATVTQQRGGAYTGKTKWQHIASEANEQGIPVRHLDPEAWGLVDGHPAIESGAFCQRCGAWRGCLGLEPSPDLFVAHIVEVFREVRRVLADDGTLWLNIGDSYAGSWGAQGRQGDSGQMASRSVVQARSIDAHPQRASGTGSTANMPGIKPKDLVGIPWLVAFALREDGWWLRQDIIWCLSGGTRVWARTQKGEMPTTIKDLVRLRPETVQLWNGEKWTQVLGWNETPREETVELRLRSGEVIGCTPHHVWPTERGDVAASDLMVGDVILTTTLPEPSTVKHPALVPDDVGRFIGLYLAEGSRSGRTVQIASHTRETDRVAFLTEFAARYGGSAHVHKGSDNGMSINLEGRLINALVDMYVSGERSNGKHLGPECWKRGSGFLDALLRGYLEGDGHLDAKNNRWRLGFCENDALAEDLRTVCARLGYGLRLNRAKHTMNGREFPGWRGEVRFQQSTYHTARKDSEVVSIGKSRARKFWHIGVEDEPHRFALASGVLTCNSKPNPMPESVTDRCTKAHEYLFLLSKRERYYYDSEAIKEEDVTRAQRWISDGMDDRRIPGQQPQSSGMAERKAALLGQGRNKRSVWSIATAPFPDAHFATFPPALVEPCILAGTSEAGYCVECRKPWERVVERTPATVLSPASEYGNGAGRNDGNRSALVGASSVTTGWAPTCEHDAPKRPGVVLDPFLGSGTTAMVAKRLGRRAVGIDLNPEYLEMARKRCAQMALLAD